MGRPEKMSEEEKQRIKNLPRISRKGIDTKPGAIKAFLSAYAMMGVVSKAAEIAGLKPYWIRKKAASNPEFARRLEQAKEEFIQGMEYEAIRRANQGIVQPVIYKGEVVRVWLNSKGQITLPDAPDAEQEVPLMEHKKSDLLMMFLLKSYRPDVYRENQKIDVTSGDKPIKAYVGFNPDEAV